MSALVGPDCRDNKHHACDGRALDIETDEITACTCRATEHACDRGSCSAQRGHAGDCDGWTGYVCFNCKAPVSMVEVICDDCNNAEFIDYLGAYE